MDSMGDLDRILGKYVDKDKDMNEGSHDSKLVIASTDPVEILNNRLAKVINENEELRRRVDQLEALVKPMYTNYCKNPTRNMVTVPDRDVFKKAEMGTPTPLARLSNTDEDASSFVNLDTSRSEISSLFGGVVGSSPAPTRAPTADFSSANPFSTNSGLTMQSKFIKSNSTTTP
ncbi:hypothetical protein LY76DRAFT_599171 [Colletotrichum caudatum]|nr:hypothetical protein LY76DRAFT_599171 [Colletotrichum caudatum]